MYDDHSTQDGFKNLTYSKRSFYKRTDVLLQVYVKNRTESFDKYSFGVINFVFQSLT